MHTSRKLYFCPDQLFAHSWTRGSRRNAWGLKNSIASFAIGFSGSPVPCTQFPKASHHAPGTLTSKKKALSILRRLQWASTQCFFLHARKTIQPGRQMCVTHSSHAQII
eukprot:scaffold224611_cov17-Tisochrysis_lutea.AAC.1